MDSGRPAFAGKCNRFVGPELTEGGERAHADFVVRAKEGQSDAWKKVKVYSPAQMGARAKDVVDTRCVLS